MDSTPATSATLHADFRRAIATIDRHVYGHFTEHLGAWPTAASGPRMARRSPPRAVSAPTRCG
ncbi:MAG: hypothetical protein HYY04_05105 [Chloroflexi bacterium]|nr:hypothetical protein [Chloroflexota bacterium]